VFEPITEDATEPEEEPEEKGQIEPLELELAVGAAGIRY
jgi:hypothetical protein